MTPAKVDIMVLYLAMVAMDGQGPLSEQEDNSTLTDQLAQMIYDSKTLVMEIPASLWVVLEAKLRLWIALIGWDARDHLLTHYGVHHLTDKSRDVLIKGAFDEIIKRLRMIQARKDL